MLIANWGNYPKLDANIETIDDKRELLSILGKIGPCIARGLGRSYGDASLSKKIISLNNLHHFLSFDENLGILECEAGTTLEEILEIFVPRGWFLPVTPGTKFITVGGAIAADIHGKNHHKEGTFSNHLLSFKILTGNHTELQCDQNHHPELFRATCGGMGLTGIITQARFRLKPIRSAFIHRTTHKTKNLGEIFNLFEQNQEVTYSVAWIDNLAHGKNLGRSLLFLGEHAEPEDLPPSKKCNPFNAPSRIKKTIPCYFPNFSLNSWSIRTFNGFYYHLHRTKLRNKPVGLEEFFYPLDTLNHWNRIYGKRGFLQYQMVFPLDQAERGISQILEKTHKRHQGSFLAVLKLFGPANENFLSFPMKGYTLAMDFPITKDIFAFLNELDEIVLRYGGRIYLAKDARMKSSIFKNTYPHLDEFLRIKGEHDPKGQFTSLQSQRLEL